MDNRATIDIKKGIKKGENIFFLYGEYIHDWFLNDLYKGICTINETYKGYFLRDEQFDYYIHSKNSSFICYELKNDEIVDCSDDMFRAKFDNDDDLGGLKSPQPNAGQNAEDGNTSGKENDAEKQARDAANSLDTNQLIRLLERCKANKQERVAVFLEDYDWTAGLYKSSNDGELTYIEKVKELSSLKNVVIVISLEEVHMLKKYNFKIDGSNVVMLASPSAEEVYLSYLRKYIRICTKDKLDSKLLKKLKDISEAVASGEKSLIESMRIFERVMKQSDGNIDEKYFEDTLDKHIEEKVSLEDVILDEQTKEKIVSVVDDFLMAADNSEKQKGLILTGPPGTGKTFLVKALANDKNCYFMSPSLADLKAEYVGQTSPKIKRLFQQARANEPTIIFIDEADTVFPSREFMGADSDSFAKDMVNQFLVEIDGMQSGKSRVFVIAATNRINILDSAIRSRLGEPIEIPLPGREQRKELFSKKLEKEDFDFGRFKFTDGFLDKTNRMSGRDIKNFVNSLIAFGQKNSKKLADYMDEKETELLFYAALQNFEDALVNDLKIKLNAEISKPEGAPKYEDIIGYENVKTIIDRQIMSFDTAKRKQAEKFGIAPKRGILLYGPTGNGKSKLAKAVANMHNLYFMKITSDVITKATLSEQNEILVKIFDGALQLSEICGEQQGVLLFFDEFDSLVSSQILDGRIRGTLLTQLDDEKTLRNPGCRVLFMAATNYRENLDEAMIRPGRIDDHAEMDNPTEDDGIRMIQIFIEKNGRVENLKTETAKYIYKKFKERHVANLKRNYLKNNRLSMILGDRTKEDMAKLAEKLYGDSRPSGSELRSSVDRLIEASYYSAGADLAMQDKLYIDESLVDTLYP